MPHPILKRATSADVNERGGYPISGGREVHFPPSPRLTRTFSAHSSALYDRSPIEVAPNTCALPARGCPGRTYYDEGKRHRPVPAFANLNTNHDKKMKPRGHLHPRAIAAWAPEGNDDEGEDRDGQDEERTPTRTSPYIPLPVPPPIPQPYSAPASLHHSYTHPSYPAPASAYSHPPYATHSYSQPTYPTYSYVQPPPPQSAPPALIPDLSSESDESDGFTSPPPEPASTSFVTGGGKYYGSPYAYAPQSAPPHPSYSYPTYPTYAPSPVSSYPTYPQSAPHPQAPAPAQPERRRRRRSPVPVPEEDGYEEDRDTPYPRASPPRPRRIHSAPAAPVMDPSPPRPRQSSATPKEKKDKSERREKDKCRVTALCRSLKGVSVGGFGAEGEGDGCLGGF